VLFFTNALNGQPDFFDQGYINNFAGIDVARPFLGSLKAPSTSVGAFAGDACLILQIEGLANGSEPVCNINPQTLVLLNPLSQNSASQPVTITKNQARFIVNATTAEQVFGTPFGDTPRNPVSDAIQNIANVSVAKNFKITERSSFEFRMSVLNAFNHTVFSSVDPFVEDAGFRQQGTGFGDNSLSNSFLQSGSNGSNRTVRFGGTFRF